MSVRREPRLPPRVRDRQSSHGLVEAVPLHLLALQRDGTLQALALRAADARLCVALIERPGDARASHPISQRLPRVGEVIRRAASPIPQVEEALKAGALLPEGAIGEEGGLEHREEARHDLLPPEVVGEALRLLDEA